jgi:hypothetical protein
MMSTMNIGSPVGAVVVDVPPDHGEQDCAEEQHHVSPLALVGGGGLAHCPAAVAGGDEVVDSLIDDALAWRAKRHRQGPLFPFDTAHLGPPWDHTLCAMVNGLRVCERVARPHLDHTLAPTSGNVLLQFSGGQVVAGSNPVSPTVLTCDDKFP